MQTLITKMIDAVLELLYSEQRLTEIGDRRRRRKAPTCLRCEQTAIRWKLDESCASHLGFGSESVQWKRGVESSYSYGTVNELDWSLKAAQIDAERRTPPGEGKGLG